MLQYNIMYTCALYRYTYTSNTELIPTILTSNTYRAYTCILLYSRFLEYENCVCIRIVYVRCQWRNRTIFLGHLTVFFFFFFTPNPIYSYMYTYLYPTLKKFVIPLNFVNLNKTCLWSTLSLLKIST